MSKNKLHRATYQWWKNDGISTTTAREATKATLRVIVQKPKKSKTKAVRCNDKQEKRMLSVLAKRTAKRLQEARIYQVARHFRGY